MMRLLWLINVLALAACSASPVPEMKIGPDDWAGTGNDFGKSHHSQLTDITPANVGMLGLAWQAELGTNRVLEATPIVIGGVMYTSGVAGRAYAFDAATGQQLWAFEPDIDMQVTRAVCCDNANRGVAVARGKVYVGALDGQFYALDAKTGKIVWQVDSVDDHKRGITSTGAPEVAGDVVILGNAGSDYDARGYVSAYDLETGKLVWRFHIVPRDPKLGPQDEPDLEPAVKTWDKNSRWDMGAGGSPWDAINYDKETGLVLVGTGNAEPYSLGIRSPAGGTNLYTSSIIAIDAKSGRLKWHYQESPADQWDYDATSPMILTHMKIEGVDMPVVLHAPKNGFLYILDRRDGKLIRASKLVRVNWAKGIDLKTGLPEMDREAADYSHGPKIIFPATPGARNWHPGSYDRATGLYYAPVADMGNLMFVPPGQKTYQPKGLNTAAALIFGPDIVPALATLPPPIAAAVKALPAFAEVQRKPWVSELRALDPLTGKTVWAKSMDGWQDRGGVLTTAGGLLFQGNLAGQLRMFDKANGILLKTIETGTSILAAPMTYRVKGVQYVAVMAAWGGGGFPYVPRYAAAYKKGNQGRLLVFKLGGGAVPVPADLPPLEVAPEAPPPAPPKIVAKGQALYFTVGCALCHSNQHRSITPDLRRMSPETHAAFNDIVLKGLLTQNGMPRWDDRLKPEDADAIHAWLIAEQTKTHAEEIDKKRRGIPLDAPSLAILSNY